MAANELHQKLDQLKGTLTPEQASELFHQLADRAVADPAFARDLTIREVGNPITVKVVPDAADWVEKQIRKATQAASDWEKGIQTPSADPKQAALAASEKHKQRTLEALNEDRYKKGIQGYDLDQAIATALAVGGTGYSRGIEARRAKITAKVQKLQPLVAANKTSIQAMPQATDADREKRMLQNLKNMRDIGKKLRG